MELVLFGIFWIVSLLIFFLVRYYSRLFAENRDDYSREEITGIKNILPNEMSEFSGSQGTMALLPFLVAVILTLLWSWMGGIIGSPHYTSEAGNYFFYSFFILLFSITFLRGFQEFFAAKTGKHSFVTGFFLPDKMIVSGIATSLIASGLAAYGAWHQLHFFFLFLNSIISMGLAVVYSNGNYPNRLIYPFLENYRSEEDWGTEEEISRDIPDIDNIDEYTEDFSDEEFKV